MGDDSSRKLNHPGSPTPPAPDLRPGEQDIRQSTELDSVIARLHVLYSHSTAEPHESQRNMVLCNSLDDLLVHLGEDQVEAIWFDGSVNHPERNYIAGWAKIFRPELTTHFLPDKKTVH